MERLWDGLEQCNVVLDTPPVTLCHGDAHIQNTYVRSDGTVGMFDFQLTLRACWARDVSYIIGTSLPVELRRRHEDVLLRGYLAELNKCCAGADRPAAAPPDFDAAKVLYAQAMAWGLVIGWLICPPNNYGERIQSANVGRLVAACQDLGTFDLLL